MMENNKINLPPPDHFTSVGILVNSGTYQIIVNDMLRNGMVYEVPKPLGGYYFRLNLDNGVEMWMAINKKYYVEAFTPYYRGDNQMQVVLLNNNENFEWRYEGGFVASFKNKEAMESRIAFDVPDYAMIKDVDKRKPHIFSFTGFAEYLDFFESEQDLYNAQRPNLSEGELKIIEASGVSPQLISTAFIPSGLFSGDHFNPAARKPRPKAVFNGIVKQINKFTNPRTFIPFYILKIETFSFLIDIVADFRKVPEAVKPGYYIGCSSWMIGHSIDDHLNKSLITNPNDLLKVRTDIINNLMEFNSIKDPNPYQD